MNYNIEILLENNEQFADFLDKKIKEFNNEHSVYHKEKRKKGAIEPINIIVSDGEGNWIGGLNADVYWGWIEINDFWFHDAYRGKGLGSQLLDKAENIAKEKEAKKALLTTFEFQARTYYEMKGYQVVGEIKDYPPGSNYYTMVKTFIQ
ncbi:GNAT family N-acetyltransferase [Oceanobacillus jeddahense]|uniref:GNAT family N-acetyltransferase n=1 Tax=Oceanobacillus jeddahense TaxID=1462527 RepID=A0ABY5JP12_9BACI|nr:GNAT family N-acetyltransferase [Oceanobacillus jeddahense]UUI01212.1 GNAT family N-acetyltransferase [Oceanobacillus jeddahense]